MDQLALSNAGKNQRYRRWFFTINNPQEADDPAQWDRSHITFCHWQKEQGESGTPHYQGLVVLDNNISLSALKAKYCSRGHFQVLKSVEAGVKYCSKEEGRLAGPFSFGSKPNPGARTDVRALYNAAVERKRVEDMDDNELLALAKYPRFFAQVQSCMPPPKRQSDETFYCVLLYGETGTGKTRFVQDAFRLGIDLYSNPVTSGLWFDGYRGEDAVLIDDFAGEFPLAQALRLFDRYPIQIPVKGGFTWYRPKYIFITTNNNPRDWYKYEGRENQRAALFRRFHLILSFDAVKGSMQPLDRAKFEQRSISFDVDKTETEAYERFMATLPDKN